MGQFLDVARFNIIWNLSDLNFILTETSINILIDETGNKMNNRNWHWMSNGCRMARIFVVISNPDSDCSMFSQIELLIVFCSSFSIKKILSEFGRPRVIYPLLKIGTYWNIDQGFPLGYSSERKSSSLVLSSCL